MNQNQKIKSSRNINNTSRLKRIVAINPGTRVMGYADFKGRVLLDYGLRIFGQCIYIDKLLDEIENAVERLILEKQPNRIILEKNRYSQITNNIRLALAVTRIKSVTKRHRIKLIEYGPKTIRAIVCKNGYATKSDLAKIIVSKFPEIGLFIKRQSPTSLYMFYNITDAVACGLAYLELKSKLE